MAVVPDTDIRLLKVPIELDYKNQITFASATAQANYFLGLQDYIEYNSCQYQRANSVMNIPAHIDSIIEYNYVMYKNDNYTDKWFYAFITNMRYVNDGLTEVTIDTDVFQTWQFDLTWKQSFVEREMIAVADDIPGANLLPEGLEFGEMKVMEKITVDDLDAVVCVAFTGDRISGDGTVVPAITVNQDGNMYNGIPSAITFIVTRFPGLAFLLKAINIDGNGDKILDVFTVPKLAVKSALPEDTPSVYPFAPIPYNFFEQATTKALSSTPSQLDGYTPRNQKLRTYPYTYLGFNPPNATQKIYRYEDFLNGTPSFKLISEINHSPDVQIIPQNYRGSSGDSLSDNVSLGGYPTLSYKTDVFNTWLAQNIQTVKIQATQDAFNYAVGGIKDVYSALGSMGSSSATSNDNQNSSSLNASSGAGLVGKAIDFLTRDINYDLKTQQQLAQIEKQQMLPDNATMSASNTTLLGYSLFNTNIFTRYSIKAQFARRLDKYFDMYGYLTNNVKVPNLNNRPNWNYVKTIGANIVANIPQADLEIIKGIFNNGVTLWHNPSTFLDYSQNNR